MEVVCLDLEGVLIPEIWISVANITGIDDLRATTRDVPDYNELMKQRLKVLHQHSLTIQVIQEIINTLEPLEGAKAFLDWLNPRFQVVILSDTFYEFAKPLMKQLNWPTLFCHHLSVNESGGIEDYQLRIDDHKRKAAESFKMLNFKVIAVGDSYNDTTMLSAADYGVFFRAPSVVTNAFPQFPRCENYDDLKNIILNESSAPLEL